MSSTSTGKTIHLPQPPHPSIEIAPAPRETKKQTSRRSIHRTGIEWCDFAVGAPFIFIDRRDGTVIKNACIKCSSGCANCYAETIGLRFKTGRAYTKAEMQHLEVRIDEGVIRSMLTFKPRGPFKSPDGRPKVFLGDMTDVHGEWVPFELLDVMYAACALRPDVDWQILTKRAERMAEYFNGLNGIDMMRLGAALSTMKTDRHFNTLGYRWPLPNVMLGTSCENQAAADERVPHLLKCPAAVRFLSCEPLIGPVDLAMSGALGCSCESETRCSGQCPFYRNSIDRRRIDWVIVGGESGPKARACDIAWIRSIVQQCKDAQVPCFVKQLGKWIDGDHKSVRCVQRWLLKNEKGETGTWLRPILRSEFYPERFDARPENAIAWGLGDAKGGDPAEWPEDLRVREWPRVEAKR